MPSYSTIIHDVLEHSLILGPFRHLFLEKEREEEGYTALLTLPSVSSDKNVRIKSMAKTKPQHRDLELRVLCHQ